MKHKSNNNFFWQFFHQKRKLHKLLWTFAFLRTCIFPAKTLPGKNIFSHHYFGLLALVSYCCLSICFQLFVFRWLCTSSADCKPTNLLAWPIKYISSCGLSVFYVWAGAVVCLPNAIAKTVTHRKARKKAVFYC